MTWESGRWLHFAEGDGLSWTVHVEPGSSKVYVHPLEVLGQAVTLASPHDHVHHRGLMFALRVDGVNFWEEGEGCGRQCMQRLWDVQLGERQMGCTLDLVWEGAAGALLHERRDLRSQRWAGLPGFVLTWDSEFTAAGRGVELSGETAWARAGVSYYGLGVRFPRAMDVGGRHRNATGAEGAEATHGSRAVWHDYTARLDETHAWAGLTLMDHPQNPRHPTEWFVMDKPFAYVSASLVARTPYRLEAGAALRLRYGVWVHPDVVEPPQITEVYRVWCSVSA